MTDWNKILLAIEPRSKPEIRAGLAESMERCRDHAQLTSKLRLAHFLSQLAHESGGFRHVVEIWGPTKAQRGYEGRTDLGNVVAGDGFRYRGRGLIQNTGRANYARLAKAFGVNFEGNPDLMANFPWAALTAAEYWRSRNINVRADTDDVHGVTRLINGGLNGIEDRMERLARAKYALSDIPAALRTQAATEASAGKQRAGQAKIVTGTAVATQAGHAAPKAATGQWIVLAGVGLALIFVAVLIARKAKDHATVAKELETAAQGA